MTFQMMKRDAKVNHAGGCVLFLSKSNDINVTVKCKIVKVESLFFFFFNSKDELVLPALAVTNINSKFQEAANEFHDQSKGLD